MTDPAQVPETKPAEEGADNSQPMSGEQFRQEVLDHPLSRLAQLEAAFRGFMSHLAANHPDVARWVEIHDDRQKRMQQSATPPQQPPPAPDVPPTDTVVVEADREPAQPTDPAAPPDSEGGEA